MRAFSIGLLLLAAGPALADTRCNIAASTDGELFADIAIHAGPTRTSAIVGVAPRGDPQGELAGFGAEFRIIDMRDGWAQVVDVTNPEGTLTAPEGWIDGAYIRFAVQTEVAFASPDPAARVVYAAQYWPTANAVLACQGDWAQIRFDELRDWGRDYVISGQITGWVRGICANQYTTCDGTWGDWARDHPAKP